MPRRETRRTKPRQANVGSVVPIVKRLMAIDALLAGDGLVLIAAAKQLGVVSRSVRRQLYILRELAGPTVYDVDETCQGALENRPRMGASKPASGHGLNRNSHNNCDESP